MIGSHRDNARFDRSRWRKRVLLPCWIIQVGLLCGLMGIFSYRLSRTINTWKEDEDNGQIPLVEFVWEGVNVLFSFISLILTLVSIARFIAEALTPLPLVFSSIIGLALAGAILALDIVVYVQHADRHYSLIGLVIDCALMVFTIIPAIYAIIIYRRLLAYDDYHLPGNVKPYGFAGDGDTSYMSMSGYLQPPAPSPYDPTNNNSTPSGLEASRPSKPRPRSLSATRRLSNPLSRGPSPSPSALSPSPQLSPDPRRASYDHRRDTQFDAYVARRASVNQEDVKRALGSEFWSADEHLAQSPPPPPPPRDSVVSSGMVSVAQARPRGGSLGRQASLEASLTGRSVSPSIYSDDAMSTVTVSTLTTGTATVQRGHSLNSVPEAHEEESTAAAAVAAAAVPADRQALLGGEHSRNGSGSSGGVGGGSRKGKKRADGRTSSTASSRSSISRYSIVDHIEGLEDIELEGQRQKRHS